MHKLGIPILLFILLILLNSCSLEQRIAVRYQKDIPKTSVLLRNSDELFFTNSNVFISNKLSEEEQQEYYDSSIVNSKFIQYMDANRFLQQFNLNYRNDLNNIGLKTYDEDSITVFLNQKRPKMIAEIMQLEIEEHSAYHYDKTFEIIENNEKKRANRITADIIDVNDQLSYLSVEIPVNAISVNAWISITSFINYSTQFNDLLFMTYEIKDKVSGYFDYDYIKEEPFYTYDISPLELRDLWQLETYSTKKFAKQILEYFANELINYQLKTRIHEGREWYWELNPNTNRLLPTHKNYDYSILEKSED